MSFRYYYADRVREKMPEYKGTDEELEWLNNYSKWVRDTLVPLLDDETAEFVKEETEPFTR